MNGNNLISSNKAQHLFAENSALFGRIDGIPEKIAEAILGTDAVNYVTSAKGGAGVLFNGYGIGDYTVKFLTEQGFYMGASYYNTDLTRKWQA